MSRDTHTYIPTYLPTYLPTLPTVTVRDTGDTGKTDAGSKRES